MVVVVGVVVEQPAKKRGPEKRVPNRQKKSGEKRRVRKEGMRAKTAQLCARKKRLTCPKFLSSLDIFSERKKIK